MSTLVLALCACSDPSQQTTKPNVLEKPAPRYSLDSASNPLLSKIEEENSRCRGGSGGDPKTEAACENRGELMERAEKEQGICWGPEEASGNEKHWIYCSDDPAHVLKKQWYTPNLNRSACIESMSPADRMREIMAAGYSPKVIDKNDGIAEVNYVQKNGDTTFWTYYPSLQLCQKSLPRATTIDKKYE